MLADEASLGLAVFKSCAEKRKDSQAERRGRVEIRGMDKSVCATGKRVGLIWR